MDDFVSVPRLIDRAKHRQVLDVWNKCMLNCETLEMTWPKLVEAMLAAAREDQPSAREQDNQAVADASASVHRPPSSGSLPNTAGPARAALDHPAAWICTRGEVVNHYAVADGWSLEVVMEGQPSARDPADTPRMRKLAKQIEEEARLDQTAAGQVSPKAKVEGVGATVPPSAPAAADKEEVKLAMQRIAQRKPGNSKLVYDKALKTIVAVSRTKSVATGLNVSSEDADVFAAPAAPDFAKALQDARDTARSGYECSWLENLARCYLAREEELAAAEAALLAAEADNESTRLNMYMWNRDNASAIQRAKERAKP